MKQVRGSHKHKMSVCDLTYAYSRGGGITTYIDAKAQYYAKQGIRHVIITPRQDLKDKVESEKKANQIIYRVPARRVMIQGLPYYFYRRYSDLEIIVRQEKPDILEFGDSFSTFFYGRRLRRIVQHSGGKVIVFVHERLDNFYRQVFHVDSGIFVIRWFRLIIAQFLTEILRWKFLAAADAVIANSEFSAQEAKNHSRKPVYTLALGIDVSRYFAAKKDEKLYAELSDGGQKTVLLHVGRLEQDKKIDLLVDFAKGLDPKRYRLIVIGDGKYRDILSTIPAVRSLGYVKRDKIISYLVTSDLGILVNDIEPFGLVGLEMMASGLPMLAPKNGGLASFIRKEFAWLLPYDANKYLQALASWSALGSVKQQKLRQAARAESQNYTIDTMGEKLSVIYQQIIKR